MLQQEKDAALTARERILESKYLLSVEGAAATSALPPSARQQQQAEEQQHEQEQLIESLKGMINDLKTEVYTLQETQRRTDAAAAAAPKSAILSGVIPAASVAAPMPVGDGGLTEGGGGGGDRCITINHSDYQKLMLELSDLQSITNQYEKENKRLIEQVKERDKDMKELKVSFYDKQEALVRENNKLRNASSSSSSSNGAAVTAAAGMVSNAGGAGGGAIISASASNTWSNLKSALDKDSLIDNRREQVRDTNEKW